MGDKMSVSCLTSESEDTKCLVNSYWKNLGWAKKLYSNCKRKTCDDCTKIYLPNIVEYNRKIGETYFKLDKLGSEDPTNSDQGIKFFEESLLWAWKWLKDQVGNLKTFD